MWQVEKWDYTHADSKRLEALLNMIRQNPDLVVVSNPDADLFIIIGPSHCERTVREAAVIARALNAPPTEDATND